MASYKEVSFIQYAAKAVAAAVVTFIGGWLVKNGVSVDTSLGEVIQVASLSLVTGVATFAKKNVPKF